MSDIFFSHSSLATDLTSVSDENNLLATSTKLIQNSQLLRDLHKLPSLTEDTTVHQVADMFYRLQEFRIQFAQAYKSVSHQQDAKLFKLISEQLYRLEAAIVVHTHPYIANDTAGRWALKQHGIGPVLAAGLIAHIDITKAFTAGSIWRYAGLDPSAKWDRNNKRLRNEQFKTLCYKIGLSFARHAEHDDCFYGKLYLTDLQRRLTTNDKDLTEEHIRSQARRFSVKIFLSHYHAVAYQAYHNKPASRPHYIDQDGQQIYVSIPYFPYPEN